MEPVLAALLGADNTQRNAAEQYYNECVARDVNATTMELFRILCTSAVGGARQLAAVLLRNLVKKLSTFTKFSAEIIAGAKHALLQQVSVETIKSVRTKITHVIAVLASQTCGSDASRAAPASAWPDLMPFVLSLVTHAEEAKRLCAFELLGQLSDYAGVLLLSDVPTVSAALAAGLVDATLPVRVAALRSTCDFLVAQCLQSGDSADDVDPSGCPTAAMLAVVGAALGAGEEQLACDALQALVTLAELGARLLADGIGEVGSAMLSVAVNSALEAGTRKLGLELIVALAEAMPARVRKSPPFVAAIVEMTITLMSEVEDSDWNTEKHNCSSATEDEDADCAWIVASESLYRLATALGKPVLKPTFAKLSGLLTSARWQQRWCGIRALDTVTEAQPKAMNRELSTIVSAALTACTDAHQRVRYEAFSLLARLPESFPTKFQKVHGAAVLPVIVAAIGPYATSGNRPRVRGTAVAATIQFCNGDSCPNAVLRPHADALMGALATLLGDTATTVSVQEEALSAVAAVSCVLEEEFARYYTSFFPSILAILSAPATAERLELRGRAMHCVGIIASTVGAEQFGPDATKVMDTLMRTMAGGMAAEDPGVAMLLEACTRIAGCLGSAFLPYMDTVLTPILALATADVGFKVVDVDESGLGGGAAETETAAGFSSVVLELRGLGKKQLTMNTFVIEQKVLACTLVLEFAKALGKDYVTFVERTATAVLPLVKFKYYEGVRSAAAFPLPKLLQSIILTIRATQAPAERAQVVAFGNGFLNACVEALSSQLRAEKAWECRACLVEALKEIFEVCYRSGGGEREREAAPILLLNVPAASSVAEFLVSLGKESFTRTCEMITKVRSHPDYDEEMEEDLEENLILEAELMTELVDAMGYITKSHGAAFLPTFQATIAPFFIQLLAPENPVSLRVNALCSFIDAIECCGPHAAVLVPPILSSIINGVTDADEGVRQCASYGIGQLAQHQPAALIPHAEAVLAKLMGVVQHAEAKAEENLEATENAIGAIGRMCIHMEAHVDSAQLLPFWLSQLPIRGDKIEACEVHSQLCALLEAGTKNAHFAPHMGHVVKIFAACLAGDEDEDGDVEQLVHETTKVRIVHLVRQMSTALPAAVMQQATAEMAPRERAAISAAIAAR